MVAGASSDFHKQAALQDSQIASVPSSLMAPALCEPKNWGLEASVCLIVCWRMTRSHRSRCIKPQPLLRPPSAATDKRSN